MLNKVGTFVVAVILFHLFLLPRPSLGYYCCFPDDCDQPGHPPCFVPCSFETTVICGPKDGDWHQLKVTCTGNRVNWQVYYDQYHSECRNQGEPKILCQAIQMDCRPIPPGWICQSWYGLIYLLGVC